MSSPSSPDSGRLLPKSEASNSTQDPKNSSPQYSSDDSSASGSMQSADDQEETEYDQSSIQRIASMIKGGKAKNIIVLTGAGLSTSAGIPDFRSPETGLYANLERLNLPFPEAVFELGYFKKNPKPFWTLAKELYPGKHFPTPAHYFLVLLERHGILKRVWSQNIDTLETLAGLSTEKIIEAHGSFGAAHCLSCRTEASRDHVLGSGVRHGNVVYCAENDCDGLVKPDIVFFGEGLPDRFFHSLSDFKHCDLLIVIGTSLQVHPFASLVERVRTDTPRLLINREPVGPFSRLPSSRSTTRGQSLSTLTAAHHESRDVYWEGDADDGVRRLVEELGWEEEFDEMISEGGKALEKAWETSSLVRGETSRSSEDDRVIGKESSGNELPDLEEAIAKQLNLK